MPVFSIIQIQLANPVSTLAKPVQLTVTAKHVIQLPPSVNFLTPNNVTVCQGITTSTMSISVLLVVRPAKPVRHFQSVKAVILSPQAEFSSKTNVYARSIFMMILSMDNTSVSLAITPVNIATQTLNALLVPASPRESSTPQGLNFVSADRVSMMMDRTWDVLLVPSTAKPVLTQPPA